LVDALAAVGVEREGFNRADFAYEPPSRLRSAKAAHPQVGDLYGAAESGSTPWPNRPKPPRVYVIALAHRDGGRGACGVRKSGLERKRLGRP